MSTNFPNRGRVRSIFRLLLPCLICWESGAAQNPATLIQQVNRAPAPPIVWNAPAPIPFGTPLSSLQLNATSAAAGSFSYQPANGAILPPGAATLSVTFSPTDQNYRTGTAVVPITVTPPGSSSFTVAAMNASSPETPLVLQPNVPATVLLAVGPVGDFHQPITLACVTAPAGRRCLFSPGVVRPTTAPVEVRLTFAPIRREGLEPFSAGLPPPAAPASTEILPEVTSSALFGILFLRRRFRTRDGRRALRGILLVLPLLALVSGCGSNVYVRVAEKQRVERVEIHGCSLVETHTTYIYVTNDDSPRGTRPASLHEGSNEPGASSSRSSANGSTAGAPDRPTLSAGSFAGAHVTEPGQGQACSIGALGI